ncbi:adenine-N(1)--methyltransferase [Aspergillus heteromorphus CBS 117.55]|uniref:tRNA (adenine(58)-N(1))-methyltransferase catalytic subunit TRM61 n=1 Tax=Aspergillus heteromorphus CBS 117.55 TaxID=1448321 RepID=A0A317W5U0_9EURO|nr:adenine-N(1)--methyltransferase [Aspergillus heteromorphus CBS 117.55]PWY80682.1 adenine-N(1)--methyltransferase [Aspergillus heteromorphus CBS 117.55]
MARMFQSLRRVLGLTPASPVPRYVGSIDTNFTYFREGDRAVIHGKTPVLTKPLRKGGKTDLRRGQLEHDKIIGSRVRDLVQARKGGEHRLSLPSLEDYVALTPRLVTPIYSADANLIVSLLDIHITPPAEQTGQPPTVEILESGTGHGSLTLHLARAIQGANSTPPPIPTSSQVTYLPTKPGDEATRKLPTTTTTTTDDPIQQNWDAWRSHRNAIIHSVDITPKSAVHAEGVVRGFRRGIYAGNVDFSAGHVEDWIAEQKRQRTSKGLLPFTKNEVEPFLSYAILDMPSAHTRIPHVTSILKRDGLLAVFMPSVTQIGDCVDLIRKHKLPLAQDKVVELGNGISSGRLWDIRHAVRRARDNVSVAASEGAEDGADVVEGESADEGAAIAPVSPEETPKEDDSVLVCRPKVGSRIVGGGFVGIWRKIEDRRS